MFLINYSPSRDYHRKCLLPEWILMDILSISAQCLIKSSGQGKAQETDKIFDYQVQSTWDKLGKSVIP